MISIRSRGRREINAQNSTIISQEALIINFSMRLRGGRQCATRMHYTDDEVNGGGEKLAIPIKPVSGEKPF